jgi:hypothetical protein
LVESISKSLRRPAIDLELDSKPDLSALVIQRRLEAKSTLELSHCIERYEIDRGSRRKVDAKYVGEPGVWLWSPPMIRRAAVEGHAATHRPRSLALDPEEVATTEINHEVIGLPAPERNRDLVAPLYQRAENLRLCLIAPLGS